MVVAVGSLKPVDSRTAREERSPAIEDVKAWRESCGSQNVAQAITRAAVKEAELGAVRISDT